MRLRLPLACSVDRTPPSRLVGSISLRSTWKEVAIYLVGRTVEEIERELILDTLAHHCGNRTQAANVLGISLRNLRNKIRQLKRTGISAPGVLFVPRGFGRGGTCVSVRVVLRSQGSLTPASRRATHSFRQRLGRNRAPARRCGCDGRPALSR